VTVLIVVGILWMCALLGVVAVCVAEGRGHAVAEKRDAQSVDHAENSRRAAG